MAFVHVARMIWHLIITCCLLPQIFTSAFSIARNDNLAVYWGQASVGNQERLSFYCNDDTIDVIPMAFLYIFFGKGGQPVINLANICSEGSGTFPGTDLADCSFLAADIKQCQAKGKIVTLSLGGGSAQVGFNSDSQAAGFATTIWNMFLGGKGSMRPFGNAVLDGVDLDIESGSSAFYGTFVTTLRSLAKGAPKQYYVTGAPQCPLPDKDLGNALNSAFFDAVYVQFYNNFCETSAPSDFNLAAWDKWAKTQSPNRNIKVYLGAPASPQSAGTGFVSSGTLAGVALNAQKQFSSFGGVMLWDASSAQTNNRYDVAVKNAIRSGPTPTSSVPHLPSITSPPNSTVHSSTVPSSTSSVTLRRLSGRFRPHNRLTAHSF
jgi:chitinase